MEFKITNVVYRKLLDDDLDSIERAVVTSLSRMSTIPAENIKVALSPGSIRVNVDVVVPSTMNVFVAQDMFNGPRGLKAMESLLEEVSEMPNVDLARTGAIGWSASGELARVATNPQAFVGKELEGALGSRQESFSSLQLIILLVSALVLVGLLVPSVAERFLCILQGNAAFSDSCLTAMDYDGCGKNHNFSGPEGNKVGRGLASASSSALSQGLHGLLPVAFPDYSEARPGGQRLLAEPELEPEMEPGEAAMQAPRQKAEGRRGLTDLD